MNTRTNTGMKHTVLLQLLYGMGDAAGVQEVLEPQHLGEWST